MIDKAKIDGRSENDINFNICRLLDSREKIDRGILDFLIKLNKNGLYTIFSCSGHKEGHTPYVDFATFITRDTVVKGMENLFGEHHYRLTEEVNGYGVKFLRMRIYPEYMKFYGIKYTRV